MTELKMIIQKTKFLPIFLFFIALNAHAAEIDMNTARMQAMDKITGHVSVINVPVNGSITFGSLSIVVRSCKTRPVEETPENFAFVDISDKGLNGEETNVFKGWMLSSSPATNALEHPIYDVWLLQCLNTTVDAKELLSEEQLAKRDNLPMLKKVMPPQKNIETEKSDKSQNSMDEMEYGSDTAKAKNPENIVNTEMNRNSEFSFDEDDDVPDEDTPKN